MAKVVAVQSRMNDVARLLAKRGYKVVDMLEASRPGAHIDAFLYTSYHSDIVSSFDSATQTDNVTLGGEPELDSATVPMVNVVGMTPEQAVDILEERLSR
ncbi:YkuS family protein [Anaeroselena agilis]|uniref:YkuS family protein n=1 Tax=Anaeroselena agilis TaxID=3063788 RepID=A0ABU3NSW0_9FIRM|nr:YkuS family protein [Selenomonadales bacterium 4137-cl]